MCAWEKGRKEHLTVIKLGEPLKRAVGFIVALDSPVGQLLDLLNSQGWPLTPHLPVLAFPGLGLQVYTKIYQLKERKATKQNKTRKSQEPGDRLTLQAQQPSIRDQTIYCEFKVHLGYLRPHLENKQTNK